MFHIKLPINKTFHTLVEIKQRFSIIWGLIKYIKVFKTIFFKFFLVFPRPLKNNLNYSLTVVLKILCFSHKWSCMDYMNTFYISTNSYGYNQMIKSVFSQIHTCRSSNSYCVFCYILQRFREMCWGDFRISISIIHTILVKHKMVFLFKYDQVQRVNDEDLPVHVYTSVCLFNRHKLFLRSSSFLVNRARSF